MMQVVRILIALAIVAFVVYQGVGLVSQIRERIRAKKKKKQQEGAALKDAELSDSEKLEGGENNVGH